MVINAVTGNPILGVDVCYSCTELNIQACAATDSEGKLDAGKYPVNSLFNVTCTMEGYDSREDVVKSRVKLDFSLASCGLGLKRAGAGREAGEGLRRRLSGRGNATAMRPQSGGKHWHCHSL